MTDSSEWRGVVGDIWADEWRRTDRAFADLAPALNAAIVAAAPVGPFRALDIGCGAGSTSVALARAQPNATVLGVDVSASLVATARARGDGQANLSFETGDAAELAASRGPFDLLLSRHGVMFFADPIAAFRALRAATGPGGALTFSCFADPAQNYFAAPLAAALGLAPPVTGGSPGPFAFADPEHTATMLVSAGWRPTDLDEITFLYRVGEGPEALDDAVGFLSRIGPAAAAMRGIDGTGKAALIVKLRRYLADYWVDNKVDLPASAWLVSARA